MIVLTGDVHHMSLKTNDQNYLQGTEGESALSYVDIAEKYGFKTTFFCSGQLCVEEPHIIEALASRHSVEIGGHNFSCFQPMLFHRISKKLLGAFHGPAFHQRREIRRTREILTKHSNQSIVSWRNHAYLSDKNTVRLLSEEGIRFYSDERSNTRLRPYRDVYLTHVPINVMPDHEHLYHAHRTPETVPAWVEKNNFCDCWGSQSYFADEWAELVIAQAKKIVEQGGVANLLIHPACMEALDNFETLRFILDELASYTNGWMQESAAYVRSGVPSTVPVRDERHVCQKGACAHS